MKLSRLVKTIAASSVLLTTSLTAQENFSVPKSQNEYDRFAHRILVKALNQSQVFFNTREFDRALSPSGLAESLRHQDLDVAWLPAKSAVKKEFNAIKIPVFKGALSYYHVQFKDPGMQGLTSIGLADIRQKSIGLLKRDANLQALAKAGFKVFGAKDAPGLQRMLDGERFDLILSPVFAENLLSKTTDRHTSATALIFAANPYYFAVHKSRPDIAIRIRKGLEELHQNGSIDQYMANISWVAQSMAKLESGQQEILQIRNADKEYAVFDSGNKYWIQPSKSTLVGAL